jgi:hypothetical protein
VDLANYTVSTEPTRLSGQIAARGSRTGMSTGGMFLFGLPFLCFGTIIAFVGLKFIHVNPRTVHAPYWVLTGAGVVFYLAGVWLWVLAYKQYKANCRRTVILAKNAGDLARADYPWDEKGCDAERWSAVLKQFAAAAAITLFLSMFNWWAFFTKSELVVKLMVSALDLAFSLFWVMFIFALGRAIKFGSSRVEFTQFPFYLGEPIVLRWTTPTGINRADSGTFQLRCVQQWYESSGSGNNRTMQVVQEVNWSGTYTVSKPEDFPPGKRIDLRFEPPITALSSNFNSVPKTVFWELAIALKERGFDFKQTYLIPVYLRAVPKSESTPHLISTTEKPQR